MTRTIQFKRGNEADLPSLASGEPAVTEDSQKLFYGTPLGNVEVAKKNDLNTTNANVSANAASLAESTQLKGTTQSIVFNTDGTIQKVQHKDSNNNVLREDVFTYNTNLITEVRTVGINTLTFKYHLDTLQTEVI